MLTAAGDQLPLKGGEFVDIFGKTGAVEFRQISETDSNVGVTDKSTKKVRVVGVAHIPAEGVNVCVVGPVTAVLTAGNQVPVIEFNEVIGKTGAVAF